MNVQELEQIKDLIQGLALDARQSGTPSKVLLEMQGQMKSIIGKMDEHVAKHETNDKKWDDALKRIEPYIKRAEDDREFRDGLEERAKHLTFWGGVWLMVAAIIGTFYYGAKHIK